MLIVKNTLNTVLIVDGLRFLPRDVDGDERLVERRTAAIYAAVENGQLEVVEEEPEPGDALILDEVIGTGVEQTLEHGLDHVPQEVAAAVSYVPALDYGGESAKPFSVTYGDHTDELVKVTATSGIRFKLIVSP
jgi:hypothetical protein